MWFYVSKPFPKSSPTQGPLDSAGVQADQKLPKNRVVRSSPRYKPVSKFAANPSAFFERAEVLVSSRDKDIQTAAEIYGFRLIEKTHLQSLKISLHRLKAPAGFNVKRARRTLVSRFPTASVDANHHFQIQQQATFRITARSAAKWSAASPSCGRNIRIGLIDTAVDLNHSALQGQRIRYQSFHHDGYAPGPHNHGTAIAGVLVGKPEWGGLLPGAQLFAANVDSLRRNGELVGNAVSIAKAIDWMVNNKVHVINMSFAGANNKIVHDAIQKAERQGIAIVAAAGNWGLGSERAYPAAYTEVLAVTALSSNGKRVASFSNRGEYIDFAAPGSQIWAPIPGGGGRYLSGTSFAAPYISVLSALFTAKGGRKTAENLRQLFRPQIKDLGAKGKDSSFGYGVVMSQPKCI